MRMKRAARAASAALLLALLASCGTAPTAPSGSAPAARLPADVPVERYAQAASRGEPVYRVDPGASLVTLIVRRAGSLARLGHDHVIASRSVQGLVNARGGSADLSIALSELSVDEPALRAQVGLDTQPTASDIEGTRANMLDKVLEVQKFPYALVRLRSVDASRPASVTLVLHGTSRSFDVPVAVATNGDGLGARGSLEIKQSDFGITPFSILGGAIQVKDEVEVRFDIRALRLKAGEQLALQP